MNNVYRVTDFLLPEELESIRDSLESNTAKEQDPALGRVMYAVPLSGIVLEAIRDRVSSIVGKKLDRPNVIFTDYAVEHGQPNLPPHFDGDNNSLLIDYQYKSNTSWDLGVNSTVYEMIDNTAIIFNPNEYPHWRPYKTFKEGEYITMAFFRFPSPDTDYSHMVYSQDHEIFMEARKTRDSHISAI